MAMTNRYAGICKGCKKNVAEGQGFVTKNELGRFICWCPECVPERIGAPRQGEKQVENKLHADGRVTFNFNPQVKDLVKAMPGSRFVPADHGGPHWTVSLAEADRRRVLELARQAGLAIAPELDKIELSQQAEAAQNKDLYDFQVIGVDFLSKKNKALLGDSMGLGKTVQALVALAPGRRVLCVVPAVVKYNWKQEAARWNPGYKVTVLSGRGTFQWPEQNEIMVCNFDILPEWLKIGKDYKPDVPPEVRQAAQEILLVVDECHRVQNPKSLRSKRVRCLSMLCHSVWGLTGTPLLNHPQQLWGVLNNLEMAREVFGSWKNFVRLFHGYQNRWGGWQWGTPDPIVPELLRRVMLRRTRPEVLPGLPVKQYSEIVVNDIPADLEADMDAAWQDWLDEDSGEQGKPHDLPPFEQFSSIRARLAESRIQAVLEYAENCEEQEVPVVIFSDHRAPVEALGQRDGWATIMGGTDPEVRQEIVDAFQRGELKGVACTIKAGGVGITLTRAWKALFVDLNWTPADNLQAEDRICRIGQESQKVQIDRMVSSHVLEQHVHFLIAKKMNLIDQAVEQKIVVQEDQEQAQDVIKPVVESEAEFQARMQRRADAEAELIRQQARGRMPSILGRLRGRQELQVPEMTEEFKQAVSDAWAAMLNVCDGAETQDNQGFNKPDASLAHWIGYTRFETPEDVEAAWRLLRGYPRQLKSRFPALWPERGSDNGQA